MGQSKENWWQDIEKMLEAENQPAPANALEQELAEVKEISQLKDELIKELRDQIELKDFCIKMLEFQVKGLKKQLRRVYD